MKRAGGWLLGLLIVASLTGGGGFVLRRLLNREVTTVVFVSGAGRDPTDRALQRGFRLALDEVGSRAGRFRIELGTTAYSSAAWLGTSEAFLLKGDHQPRPLSISVFDTHPSEPTDCFRITPGCEQQASAAAAWAKKSGAARVYLLREEGSLRSESIAAAFASRAKELGLTVEGPFSSSITSELIRHVMASHPDLVFYSGEEAPYSETQRLFSAFRAYGYRGTLLMGEADPEVSFLATRPDLVDGTYLVSPFAPAPPELAQAMGTTPGPHVTAGYFAMKAALEAIDRANSIDPEELRRAAATLPYFDAQGKAALRKCALYRARDNKFEFVELLD
jgi:hypothetical protein